MEKTIKKARVCYKRELAFVSGRKPGQLDSPVNDPAEPEQTARICPTEEELSQVIAICQYSIIAQYREWLRNSVGPSGIDLV